MRYHGDVMKVDTAVIVGVRKKKKKKLLMPNLNQLFLKMIYFQINVTETMTAQMESEK